MIGYLLSIVVAILFVIAVVFIAAKAKFTPQVERWTGWVAGGLAILYLILVFTGKLPPVPVPAIFS